MLRAVEQRGPGIADRQGRTTLLKLLRDNPGFVAPLPSPQNADGGIRELERFRCQSREWAQRSEGRHRQAFAARFTSHALEVLASELNVQLEIASRLPGSAIELDREARTLADSIGQRSAELPLAEGLYFLTSLYPALLSEHTRAQLGAFYTPPALTSRLLDLLTEHGADWATARVLDPAAGAGAFLLGAAERMLAAMRSAEPAFVLRQLDTRLVGLEIDAYAAVLAQGCLEIRLADLIRDSGKAIPQFVRVCDSLEASPDKSFDIVLGNPPYGRVTLAAEVRKRFARSLYGHANLYGVFTDVAVRWAKAYGLIGYLTPTSMLGGQYFSALREMLAKEAPPIALDFVHARKGVFEDVLQETLLALYRRGANEQRIQVHYLIVRKDASAELVRNGTVALPSDPRGPWLAPRDPKHSAVIDHAKTMPSRLKDWGYEVSTGPLVWNRFKSQLQDRPGHNAYPLIWAESVTADGRFLHRAEKRNHAPYFRIEQGDDWLLVKNGCVLLQRTTAKEQARRLITAEMPQEFVDRHGGVVVENHLNMVRAKAQPAVSTRALAAVLNSHVADQVFRCISGSVAVSAFELESLPLPSIEAMQQIECLLAGGAARAKVEAAIAALYGQVSS